jgi:hypothetical protein
VGARTRGGSTSKVTMKKRVRVTVEKIRNSTNYLTNAIGE